MNTNGCLQYACPTFCMESQKCLTSLAMEEAIFLSLCSSSFSVLICCISSSWWCRTTLRHSWRKEGERREEGERKVGRGRREKKKKGGEFATSCISQHQTNKQKKTTNRVSFSFLPKGGSKMKLYGLFGRQVCIHVQSMWQTRGVWGHTPLGNFDFGSFIRRTLMKCGTVFAQTQFTIYCVIKAFIFDLHVK